jgi:hypothetical protein
MRVSALSLLLCLGVSNAFAPLLTQKSTTTTALNLFGGAKKDGKEKPPGMMDQLAMFKKAQEMASKKNKLDEELSKEIFEGNSADGKVKGTFKFVPIKNPMDPNPDYEAISFEFDEEWYEAASPDDLSAGVKESVLAGIEATNMAVTEKYKALQGDLMAAFGEMAGEAEAPPS